MRNKLNMEFFSCKKYKDVFKIYICGFACMNKLGNQSVSVQVFQPVLQWWNDRPVLLIIRSAKACLWPRLSEPKSFSTLRPMEYRPAKYVLYVVVVVSRTVVVLRNLVFLPTSAEAWQNVAAKIFCKSCDWFIAVHGLLLPFISLISKQFVHVVVFQFGRNCEVKLFP